MVRTSDYLFDWKIIWEGPLSFCGENVSGSKIPNFRHIRKAMQTWTLGLKEAHGPAKIVCEHLSFKPAQNILRPLHRTYSAYRNNIMFLKRLKRFVLRSENDLIFLNVTFLQSTLALIPVKGASINILSIQMQSLTSKLGLYPDYCYSTAVLARWKPHTITHVSYQICTSVQKSRRGETCWAWSRSFSWKEIMVLWKVRRITIWYPATVVEAM